MDKWLRSFRARMIALLALSMLLSGLATYAVFKGLQYYYSNHVRYGEPLERLRHAIRSFGDLNFFLILFVPLAVLFFFFLTKPYAAYFREISDGIGRLASGDFSGRVDIASRDEFESIARDINAASANLQRAVERGDFAESSKDQLVLNLAHDLRTPLTSVLGYLDLILREGGLSPEQKQHYTSIAFNKSRRLEKLIDGLFEVTRMNYGRLPLETEALDLSELLAQLNEELYPLFQQNRLSVRPDIAPGLIVNGDGELLARVFENLLANAARYGRDGEFVDVQCGKEGEEAVVRIANYGDMIPEDELPRLFEMFYKGDRARTHQEGSTGLGLFIAKNIIDRHKGKIAAESSAIRTVFEVRLPLQGQAG
ncbi:sensor histidine kinase [Paenibacillus sp. D9]|uniref:sensor histidine kinase n=1 Tax=Paenibacillus TaxID=44249 RepID=UPI00061EC9A9|nr:HAMP domain-containing sensor histidine kinase [Paenibacillus sp. D9]KKC48239.1 histidine kinase [Paenibacillus sp. D9]